MGVPKLFLALTILVLLTAVGCSDPTTLVHTSGNPDAKEVLALDPEADIFQFEGLIYITGIDWVEDLTLTKDEQVGEIKKRNDKDTNFEDEMSNKLQVDAKIYSPIENEGPILLVESEGEILKYYASIEG